MQYFISILLLVTLSYAEVIPTEDMADDSLSSTVEFQYFIIKTRDVDVKGLTSKVVFEGELDDYYEFYEPLMQTNSTLMLKSNLGEVGLQSFNGGVSNAMNGSGGSNVGGMLAAIGLGIVINQAVAIFDVDDIFLKVTDYYDEKGEGVTRITKMIVSEDDMDDDEVISVYKTSDDTSYHYYSEFISKIHED